MTKQCLYLITDFSYGEEKIAQALQAGVDYVQLREKEISSAEYLCRARRIREMVQKWPAKLIINDRLDIALLCGADGVHLGQSDIPAADARKLDGKNFIIGVTAKTPEQAAKAQADGADYLASGAWYSTNTKKDAVPISDDAYRAILSAAPLPNVAVGGLTVENCDRPLLLGASGLAVSAGIMASGNIPETIRMFREKLSRF